MNIIELKKYIELNYSIANLASHFNKGKSTIRYWLKKYELKTTNNLYNIKTKNNIYNKNIKFTQICKKCNIDKSTNEYYFNKKRNNYMKICKKCHNKKNHIKKNL